MGLVLLLMILDRLILQFLGHLLYRDSTQEPESRDRLDGNERRRRQRSDGQPSRVPGCCYVRGKPSSPTAFGMIAGALRPL